MRLGDRDAVLIDAVVDHEHQLAVYDADGEIVPLTPVPFDPYASNYSRVHEPYEVVDLDGDGSDEIVVTDAFTGWIRVVAVRGHTLMTTREHMFIDYSESHARRIYAHDPLVPLSSVVAPPLASYACGTLAFVLSKPSPVSQVVTVYRTGTHHVLVGPREGAWYPPRDRWTRMPCKALVAFDGDGLSYVDQDW